MADDDNNQASGGGKFPTPPYIAYKTLQTLLGDLKAHGLPPQIDRSVLTRFSGGVQGQLMIALRVMGLVDEKTSAPTPKLAALVEAYETPQYQAAIKAIVAETYPYVLSIDLATATPSMFTKAFSDATGAGEESLRKCRAFFLAAARDAGISIGARIEKAKFPRARSSIGKKLKPKAVVAETATDGTQLPTGNGGLPMSDHALEYKLIDLMKEEGIGSEERAAIWTLVQYLTAKAAKTASASKKTATDQ